MAMSTAPQSSTGGPAGLVRKAWVSLTPSTGAIISSSNVSGVVRNATGDYTVTFTSAMTTTTYIIVPRGDHDFAGATNPGFLFVCTKVVFRLVGSVRMNVYCDEATTRQLIDPNSLHLEFWE